MKTCFAAAALALISFGVVACATPVPTADVTADIASPLLRVSADNFATTDARLAAALAARPLKVFAVIDHGAGAKSVEKDIGQSKLYIFGNPKSGTPLMVANGQMGLELPMKMLVRETGIGTTEIVWQDVSQWAAVYGIENEADLLDRIGDTLDDIAAQAATAPVR